MSGNVTYLEDPDKSKNDKKTYKNLRLANGMTCLLISDLNSSPVKIKSARSKHSFDPGEDKIESSDCDSEIYEPTRESKIKNIPVELSNLKNDLNSDGEIAACCLTIDVGSFSEPNEFSGLAHFLEHMIHKGSAKYPGMDAYFAHINKCSGAFNANTEDERTHYYFVVPSQHLDLTMDYFAAALKSPELNEESMQQEIIAIEHEFGEILPDYESRRDQILIELSNRNYPHCKFTWGNFKSLKENVNPNDLLKALRDFHKRHYSAHRMYLCVQAHLKLNELEKLIIKNFSDIPNNNLQGVQFHHYPHNDAFLKVIFDNIIFVRTEEKESYLEIMWVLPPSIQFYKSKPTDFVAYFIGYWGYGSLTSYLRKKYWIVSLDCGVDESSSFDCNSMFSLFKISILLTKDGFSNILQVISAIFAYIRLLPKAESLKSKFTELKLIAETNFDFEPENSALENVQYFSRNMKYYSPKHVLNGSDLLFEFDPYLIQTVIDNLKHSKYNLFISSNRKVTENEKGILFTEKWFDTEYLLKPIPETWRKVLFNPQVIPELLLPAPNEYICKDFRIFWIENGRPILPKNIQKILNTDVVELWFKQDDKYLVPMAFMCLKFFSPLPRQSPKNAVLLAIYARLLNYYLEEKLCDSLLCGLNGKYFEVSKGLILKIKGYNEKVLPLSDLIIKIFINIRQYITEKQFYICKENVNSTIHHMIMTPKILNSDVRLSIVESKHWTLIEKFAAIQSLNFNDMLEFCGKFTQELYIKALIQGNLTEEIAHCIISNVLETVNCSPIREKICIQSRARQIPLGSNYLRCRIKNVNNANSVICNYYQIGPTSLYSEVILNLIIQIITESMFTTLRTKEQLGYSVWPNVRCNCEILGYTLSVISLENLNSAFHVEKRIEAFRNTIIDILNNVSDDGFQNLIETEIKGLEMPNTTLIDDFIHNWYVINQKDLMDDPEESEDLMINREEGMVKILQTLTRQQLIDFWIENDQTNYRKLSIQVVGFTEPTQETETGSLASIHLMTNAEDSNVIKNVNSFKQNLYVFPVNQPK